MRTVQESLFQAMPGDTPLGAVAQELTANLGVSSQKGSALVALLQELPITTASQLMAKKSSQLDPLFARAGMTAHDVQALTICLGSSVSPFQFSTSEETPAPDAHQTTTLIVQEVAVKVDAKKGGTLIEAAERMPVRRPPMVASEYYPPAVFDSHRTSLPTRSEPVLRKEIVKEIRAVCGDLYPTQNERDVIIGAIEAYCGAPTHVAKGHYNNWRDHSGLKHKGTAISDLEKARTNQAAWGVPKEADRHPMRPARPPRVLVLPRSTVLSTPRTGSAVSQSMEQHGAEGVELQDDAEVYEAEEVEADSFPQEGGSLMTSAELLAQCNSLKKQLESVQEQQQATKAAKGAARKEAAAIKAAAKAAAKEAAGGADQHTARKRQARKKAAGAAAAEGVPASDTQEGPASDTPEIEKRRRKTIAGNAEALRALGLDNATLHPPKRPKKTIEAPPPPAPVPPYPTSDLFKTHAPLPDSSAADLQVRSAYVRGPHNSPH